MDHTFDYRADVRGRSVDAGALLRLAFGGADMKGNGTTRPTREEVTPELRPVVRRVHPF